MEHGSDPHGEGAFRASIKTIGEWVVAYEDLLRGLSSLRELGSDASGAVDAVMQVRPLLVLRLSWQLLQVLAADDGYDWDVLVARALSVELIQLVEAAVFDDLEPSSHDDGGHPLHSVPC